MNQSQRPQNTQDQETETLAGHLQKMRYELTALQAKLSQAMTLAARKDHLHPCAYCPALFHHPHEATDHEHHHHGGVDPYMINPFRGRTPA